MSSLSDKYTLICFMAKHVDLNIYTLSFIKQTSCYFIFQFIKEINKL
jgi:hypothetical protein